MGSSYLSRDREGAVAAEYAANFGNGALSVMHIAEARSYYPAHTIGLAKNQEAADSLATVTRGQLSRKGLLCGTSYG